jgi:hypothetical protein
MIFLGFKGLGATLHCAIGGPYEPREKEGRGDLNILLSLLSGRPGYIDPKVISRDGKPFNSWATPVYDVAIPVKAVDRRSPSRSVTPVFLADPDPPAGHVPGLSQGLPSTQSAAPIQWFDDSE